MFDVEKLNTWMADNLAGGPVCGTVSQIFGGASRDTWRVQLVKGYADTPAEVILRVPQPSGLIDTDQSLEVRAYEAFADTDVPVPGVIAVDESGDVLGRPFLMMEVVAGEAGNPFAKDFYAGVAEMVGKDFWTLLGRIARNERALQRLAPHFAATDIESAPRRELDYWLDIYANKSLGPDPLLEAAVRWLNRNPPEPSGAAGVVHGDYRMGNFLVADGRITAVLDWEMVHIGDPLEDVGWAFSYLWSRFSPERPGAMIDAASALEIWSEASGRAVDAASLHWWRVFNAVKGMVIWHSAGTSVASGANPYPGYLNGAWLAADLHQTELMNLLDPAARRAGS